MTEVTTVLLGDDGDIPNNPTLPLLVYKAAARPGADGDAEDALEALFAANGWGNGWRGGVIYSFHHYHAQAHEVVGVGRGRARIRFGGPAGPVLEVEAGDAVLIPAGVAHCRVDDDPALSVVAAYPPGQQPDMRREGEAQPALMRELVAGVGLPARDPVLGANGGTATHWRSA